MNTINLEVYVMRILQSLPPKTVKNIFLIGSYAKNKNNNNSDVDIIVVSDCFNNISGYLRERIVTVNLGNILPKPDIKCLTVKEFNRYCNSKAYNNEILKKIYDGRYDDEEIFDN